MSRGIVILVAALTWSPAASHELGQHLGMMGHSSASAAHGFGGDKMERSFGQYVDLPIGESALAAAKWTKHEDCDVALGYMWTQDSKATKSKPVVLYTTKAGQLSGVGVHIYGELPEPQRKWVTDSTREGQNGFRIDVAFRSGPMICDGSTSPALIGDKLIVNPGGKSNDGETKELSLTEDGAEAGGWHRGSCFDGMGWHRFLDTSTTGTDMSWKAENLFPVVTMYHQGEVNAIFFASWVVQQGFDGPHQWEPVPLPDFAMCKNTCDSDCTFEGTNMWSTLHIYFRNHNEVKCDASLKCSLPGGLACCPADLLV